MRIQCLNHPIVNFHFIGTNFLVKRNLYSKTEKEVVIKKFQIKIRNFDKVIVEKNFNIFVICNSFPCLNALHNVRQEGWIGIVDNQCRRGSLTDLKKGK